MKNFTFQIAALVMTVMVLTACTSVPVITGVQYTLRDKQHLYELEKWQFYGRLAVRNKLDSWSASIRWRHTGDKDSILISGPFGQDAVSIVLSSESMTLDHGDGVVETSDNPDQLIRNHLGVAVPVKALRYWVVGLPLPGASYSEAGDGFLQEGWNIRYLEMMQENLALMPHKFTVTKNKNKLTLVIDQWLIDDRSS